MTTIQAAYEILKKNRKAMSAKEISDAAISGGLLILKSKTPEATIGAAIYMDIKKHGAKSRFVKAGTGLFSLSETSDIKQSKQQSYFDIATSVDTRIFVPVKSNAIGKVSPSTAVGLSFTDCAEKVLRSQMKRSPMHYAEITEVAKEKGWLVSSGKTPEATMYAQILTEIKKMRGRGEVPRFVKCGKGFVALSAWDKSGVDFQIQQHHEDMRKKLKAKLMQLTPEQFEELVSILFTKIGFREVSRTKLSGDGGIDIRGTLLSIGSGVVRTELAIQAKKWKSNVHSPIVQMVRGSLGAHEQGCIVTTSSFSKGAREEAARNDVAQIALIDGNELVNLMLENQVGVSRTMIPLYEIQDNLLDDSSVDDGGEEVPPSSHDASTPPQSPPIKHNPKITPSATKKIAWDGKTQLARAIATLGGNVGAYGGILNFFSRKRSCPSTSKWRALLENAGIKFDTTDHVSDWSCANNPL